MPTWLQTARAGWAARVAEARERVAQPLPECQCGMSSCRRQVRKEGPNKDRWFFGPSRAQFRVPLFAVRTLNATGQSRVTLSLW